MKINIPFLLMIMSFYMYSATAQTVDTTGFPNLKKVELPHRFESIHFIYQGDCNRPHHGTLAVCVGIWEQPYDRGYVDSIAGSAILVDDRTYDTLRRLILDCPFMDYEAPDQAPFQCECDMAYCMEITDHRGLHKRLYSKYWGAFFSYLSAFLDQGHYDQRLVGIFKNPYEWPSTIPLEEGRKVAQRRFNELFGGRVHVGTLGIPDSTSEGDRRN